MSKDTGQIVTVDGRIAPDELGFTLPHEHTFIDAVEDRYEPPDSAYERRISREPVSLDNLWWVRANPFTHKDNMRLDSYEDAVDEVRMYRQAGGEAIVDVSPKNNASDPELVRDVARETGITYVHGTAYYTRATHPEHVDESSLDDLTEEFVSDVVEGIGETDVRAGIVGEIGLSEDIHEQEEKVLRAGCRAALQTGASVSIHPPYERSAENPTSRKCLWALDICEEEGLSPERVVMCHRDGTKYHDDMPYQKELADRGAYLEYDLFGQMQVYHAEQEDAGLSDFDRMDRIMELIDAGHADRVLMSHDIFVKMFLAKYGGDGYGHIPRTILPIMAERGVDSGTLETITVDNPARVLAFREPAA